MVLGLILGIGRTFRRKRASSLDILSPKRAPRGFYKGKNCKPTGFHTRKGNCYQQSDKALNFVASSVMSPFAPKEIVNGPPLRGLYSYRFSTLADVSDEPAPEEVDDLLSFIKSSLDELEGTHHYWLNRSFKNKQFFGSERIILVLAARCFESGIMFQKLKTVQERFPHVITMGLKQNQSSDQVDLIQLLMEENITFPILLSQQTFPQIEKDACYILFKNFSTPVIFDVEDVGLEVLYEAVQLLQMQPSDDSKFTDILRCTSLKQDDITKDQYMCSPLQNLLLYHPGCISADESSNSLFISDCNHHRIIVCNGNGEIKDCESSDQSPNRQHKFTTQLKNRYGMNNGAMPGLGSNAIQNKTEESAHSNLQGNYMELGDLVDGHSRPPVAVQYSPDLRELKLELEQKRSQLSNLQLKLQEERELNNSFREELKMLKLEKDQKLKEMSKIHNELNEKVSEIKHLHFELTRRENEESAEAVDSLKRLIQTLERENATLKMEKNEIEATLDKSRKFFTAKMSDAAHTQKKNSSSMSDMPDHSESFPGKEEMERSLQELSKDLKVTQRDRDKALQELSRLKQHLLEKASEESEKMDEDSKIIEELRDSNNHLRAQISHLERTLKQAIASREELKMANNNEILKSRESIDDLNKKLTNCLSTIDSKSIELSNLQTALGQYYAEIEAKEYLEEELAWAREEMAKLSQLLKDADQRADVSKGEKEEILAKLSQSEKVQTEWKNRVSKLEEDNAKLRRALEQSMMRLNRMSVDSDYLVDRRIVIKLLVTYFQRNYSREVLDLIVRMLGFSDEDKQRIGVAQQGAGKGVVRGVFGLPGRLVGGILGGSSTEAAANAGSDNQSFTDLWVDFLLKETEEREKKELSGNTGTATENSLGKSSNTYSALPPLSNQRFGTGTASTLPITSTNQSISPPPLSRSYFQRSDTFGSEFSTVPLTPSDGKTTGSNILPSY